LNIVEVASKTILGKYRDKGLLYIMANQNKVMLEIWDLACAIRVRLNQSGRDAQTLLAVREYEGEVFDG
jgi:hypothetical protein